MSNVLLIYPSQLYAPFWGERTNVKPHMLSLFSFLRHNKINVEVFDLENEIGRPKNEDEVKIFLERASEIISRFNFNIVAISCWSSLNYLSSISVADICKGINHRSTIVVGGYHPSALPGDFIYERSPFDFIVTGEGEVALVKICKNEERKDAGTKIIHGTPLLLDKEFATDWKHYKYTRLSSADNIYLSRGCLYSCAFCMEGCKGHKTWRSYSVVRAIEKIKEIIEVLKPKMIAICDACFGFNKTWRRKFLYELVKHKIDTNLWAETRIDLLDKEDIDLLSKLNFSITFGLESGSEEMLCIMRKTNKPKAYLKKCEDVISYLNKKQVPYNILLIFNHPGETLATYDRSVGFFSSMISRQNRTSGFLIAQDYAFFPGSQIHRSYDYYQKRFGTVVVFKEWWNERDNHYRRARTIIPSRELFKQPGGRVDWLKTVNDLNRQSFEKMSVKARSFWDKRSETIKQL